MFPFQSMTYRCPLKHTRLFLSLLAVLASAGTAAQAQAIPDAGQSIRDIERQPPTLPPRQHLDINLPNKDEGPVSSSEGPRIAVKAFQVTGNTQIDDATIAAQLADLAGRELTLAQLREGARRITQLYRERGYPLARAWLPQQEMVQGVVRMEIIEGRYGAVRVDNQAHLNPLALGPLKQLAPGEVVKADSLEHALLLMRELSGVNVTSTLQPGTEVGTTDLAVELTPDRLLQGSVDINNYGNHYTGEYRLSAALEMGNLLGLGDQLSLRVLGTDDKQLYGRVGWQSGGLGRWGTQLGVGYSHMQYTLGKDFDVLDATGSARVASVWATQPLIRSRTLSLSAAIQFDHKRLQDDIGLYASRNAKHSQVVQASLSGNGNDDWLGGGASSFSLAWSSGSLHLEDAAYRATDAFTARTRGNFQKMNVSLARWQQLSAPFSLYGSIEGQWANRNLDSSEKMGLGGAYGVRAYPQGEASGDQGWLGKLELRYAVAPGWQLSTFVEHGEVRTSKKPWVAGRNSRSLSGAGLGAYWSDGVWYMQASMAWKLGSEEPTSGPKQTPRLWAQLGRRF